MCIILRIYDTASVRKKRLNSMRRVWTGYAMKEAKARRVSSCCTPWLEGVHSTFRQGLFLLFGLSSNGLKKQRAEQLETHRQFCLLMGWRVVQRKPSR
jgi:hypothetical protein